MKHAPSLPSFSHTFQITSPNHAFTGQDLVSWGFSDVLVDGKQDLRGKAGPPWTATNVRVQLVKSDGPLDFVFK